MNPNEIVELLLACDELNFNQLDFNELLVDLQNKLIEKEKEWVPENTNNLYQISFRYQSFNILQDYFEGLINNTAEYFLKSHDYRNIEKPILMSILKKDILHLFVFSNLCANKSVLNYYKTVIHLIFQIQK